MSLDTQLEAKRDHLEIVLTQKIGYGHAQQKLIRSLYLLLFSQGCESIVLGLLLPVLRLEWDLSVFEQSMIITVVYLGVAAGSYFQTYSDNIGRHRFITYDAVIQTVFGLLSCVCWNYQSFLVMRFFYGVGIGICLPLSASYIAEISPAYMRATLMARSRMVWSGGCLFSCVLGWYFLADNSWRWLLFSVCLPGMYAIVQHMMHGRQSLRYLWVQGRTQQVHELTNYMCRLNGQAEVELSYLNYMMEQDSSQKRQTDENVPMSAIFSPKYIACTWRLLVCWWSSCFIYYGVMLLLPSILGRVFGESSQEQTFKYLFLVSVTLVEVISFGVSYLIMDHPVMGRKRSTYLGFALILAAACLTVFIGESHKFMLFLMFVIIKFIVTAVFLTVYPYTSEVYETLLRGKAMGLCSFVGRIATTFLGIVGVSSLEWFGGNGLYYIFILFSAMGAISALTMPFCTLNRPIE